MVPEPLSPTRSGSSPRCRPAQAARICSACPQTPGGPRRRFAPQRRGQSMQERAVSDIGKHLSAGPLRGQGVFAAGISNLDRNAKHNYALHLKAGVMKLVDVPDSKSGGLRAVSVRLRPPANPFRPAVPRSWADARRPPGGCPGGNRWYSTPGFRTGRPW
jgi:hypothetical protein